ncbi:MAG: S41 family peptidase [Chloroflexia bacterium]|nr:S41 family peptidase [Chloroflexia bacterium]
MRWYHTVVAFVAGWVLAMTLAATPYGGDIAQVVGPGTIAQLQTPWGMRIAFAPFWEAWQVVDAVFYAREKIDHARMIKGAIDGMLASLGDKYTFYQEPEKAKQTSDDMRGKTVGIGIYLRITDGNAYVWKPIANAPATKAGVQHDDQIIAVDAVQIATVIAGKSVDEASVAIAALIRGEAGTTVTLTLQRGTATPFRVTITRAEFVLPSVEWQTLAGNIAYIHISEFKTNTPDILVRGMREFGASKPRGYILDLRHNPGGLVDSAQGVLGLFYDGTALYEQRATGVRKEFRTTAPATPVALPTARLIVLIDGNSASASEIVAGALRDRYPDVQLVGTQSFGKGIVQNIYPLSNGGTIRLTISQWLTPNRIAIHGVGLTPDLVVDDDATATANAPCVAERKPAGTATLCRDPQLNAAIGLIP